MLRRLKAEVVRWRTAARRVYVVDLIWRTVDDFMLHGGTTFAAAMSYYVLFSLFLLLIFVVAVFGLLARDPAVL